MLKKRVKLTSGCMKRVWKTIKCQVEIREKSGNFEVEYKWQPCKNALKQSRRRAYIVYIESESEIKTILSNFSFIL